MPLPGSQFEGSTPESACQPERRQCLRVQMPIDYRVHDDKPRQRITDISLGGVRVSTDESWAMGQDIEIELWMPNKRIVTCRAKVIWINTINPVPVLPTASKVGSETGSEPSSPHYDVGLQFTDLSIDAFLILAHQIKRYSLLK